MIKHLVVPFLTLIVLAIIRGIVPAGVAALALLIFIAFSRIAIPESLRKRADREIVDHALFGGKRSGARTLVVVLNLANFLFLVASTVFLFRKYDWVVGVGFIVAVIGYVGSLSASASQST